MKIEEILLEKFKDETLVTKPEELMQRGGAYYSDSAAELMADIHSDAGTTHIVNTLNNGESLKIVIFCLIFGVALGHLKTEGQRMLVEVLKSIQQASISIFKFLNYFLPIALLAMISSQVGKVGVGIFMTMFDFVMQQAIGGFLVIALGTVVIWMRSGLSPCRMYSKPWPSSPTRWDTGTRSSSMKSILESTAARPILSISRTSTC